MFVLGKVAALQAENAALAAENRQLREQLGVYLEREKREKEQQERWGRQWDKLMGYTGENSHENEA